MAETVHLIEAELSNGTAVLGRESSCIVPNRRSGTGLFMAHHSKCVGTDESSVGLLRATRAFDFVKDMIVANSASPSPHADIATAVDIRTRSQDLSRPS